MLLELLSLARLLLCSGVCLVLGHRDPSTAAPSKMGTSVLVSCVSQET